MLEFLRAIKNKYRVYLLTKIAKKEGSEAHDEKEYDQINELLMKLVKQDIIKGKHRLMYSTSEVGHIAQIRHLASDLHLESKYHYSKIIIFVSPSRFQHREELDPVHEQVPPDRSERVSEGGNLRFGKGPPEQNAVLPRHHVLHLEDKKCVEQMNDELNYLEYYSL